GRVSGTPSLRCRLPRRASGADGVGVVVLALMAGTGISGALSGAVHAQPPDVAGRRASAVASGGGRLVTVHPSPAKELERDGAPVHAGACGASPCAGCDRAYR